MVSDTRMSPDPLETGPEDPAARKRRRLLEDLADMGVNAQTLTEYLASLMDAAGKRDAEAVIACWDSVAKLYRAMFTEIENIRTNWGTGKVDLSISP
jgi:hypothetical protein